MAKDFLEAVRPSIEPTLVGMTWTRWVKINRQIVADMAKAGASYEQILDAWERKSTSLGGPCRRMDYVQNLLAKGPSSVVRGPWGSDPDGPDFPDLPGDVPLHPDFREPDYREAQA